MEPSTTRAGLPSPARSSGPFDALVLRPHAFYWRGRNHRERGAKGPGSGTFGGEWSGSPRIDNTVSPNRGRTVISALRVNEVRNGGPVKGVMGSTDSRWRCRPLLPGGRAGVSAGVAAPPLAQIGSTRSRRGAL